MRTPACISCIDILMKYKKQNNFFRKVIFFLCISHAGFIFGRLWFFRLCGSPLPDDDSLNRAHEQLTIILHVFFRFYMFSIFYLFFFFRKFFCLKTIFVLFNVIPARNVLIVNFHQLFFEIYSFTFSFLFTHLILRRQLFFFFVTTVYGNCLKIIWKS